MLLVCIKEYNVEVFFLLSIFSYFEIKLFCFVVALSNLVQNVETMHDLC